MAITIVKMPGGKTKITDTNAKNQTVVVGGNTKSNAGTSVSYDASTDYTALMNQAAAQGDYASAARYEQQRNAKIADLDASGTNKWNATASNTYSQYLGAGNSGSSSGARPSYADSYVANDQYGVNHQYAKDYPMSAQDLARLTAYGEQYNQAAAQMEQELAGATSAEQKAQIENYYRNIMNTAHTNAEAVRAQYGYSGGEDGSEFLQFAGGLGGGGSGGGIYGSWDFEDAPTYNDRYSSRIDELLNQILNREDFSYDAEKDDLFQQYKTQYEREGNRAMKDTLGEMSARTGGLASSWAGSVGQQTYNYYASQVADKLPELYELAYQMYLDDIELQVQDLGLMEGVSNTQYNRYRDTMSDWRNDRDFSYNKYRDDVSDYQWEKNFAYNAGRDDVADSQWAANFGYNAWRDSVADNRYDQEWEYGTSRDEVADSRYESETAYAKAMEQLSMGIMPSNSLLASAGLTVAQATAYLASQMAGSTSSSGSKSSGGTSSSSGSGGGKKPGGTTNTKDDDGSQGKTDVETTPAPRVELDQQAAQQLYSEVVTELSKMEDRAFPIEVKKDKLIDIIEKAYQKGLPEALVQKLLSQYGLGED